MTPDEMIEVIQAYRDGKQIERYNSDRGYWVAESDCKLNFSLFEYRIKPPEPVSIPATEYELGIIYAWHKHKESGNIYRPVEIQSPYDFYKFNPDTKCWEEWGGQ